MVARGTDWPYGKKKVYHVDELKPGKKKKKKLYYGEIGMFPITIGESMTTPVGDAKDNLWKHKKSGKIGKWRNVRGKPYFFPDDGSGPIPPVPTGGKGKGKKAGEKGGGGDEKGKEEKKDNIPNRKKMLEKVDAMILKASRSKRGKIILKPLKKMQAALKADDKDAFKKAEADLAKATKKLKKKTR
jgi:hypothetical protein